MENDSQTIGLLILIMGFLLFVTLEPILSYTLNVLRKLIKKLRS